MPPAGGRTDGRRDIQTDGRTSWIQYTPAPPSLSTPSPRLFSQSFFFQAQIKENIKGPRHWPLRHSGFPSQWPVTRKTFPFDDVIMKNCTLPKQTWAENDILLHLSRKSLISFGISFSELLNRGSHTFSEIWFQDFSRTYQGQNCIFQALSNRYLVFRKHVFLWWNNFPYPYS